MNRLIRAAEALGIRWPQNLKPKAAGAIAIVTAFMSIFMNAGLARAATYSAASESISDPRPSATAVNYTSTVSGVTATALRCIKATFVTTPSGSTAIGAPFSTSAATVSGSSSLLTSSTGTWTVADTANTVTYTNTTNTTVPSVLSAATFIIQNVNNGATADTSYWIQLKTFSDSACSSPIDNATMGFIFTNGSTLSLSVDPTLSFSIGAVAASAACDGTTTTQASTSTTIPFGSVTSTSNSVVCQDLIAATNATNGYTVYVRDTASPTNALSQTIADTSGTNTSPATFPAAGTEAYGYTTNAAALGTGTANRFVSPAQEWAKMTQTNSEVAYSGVGVNSTTTRIAHQVGVSLTTKPGTYQTTVLYTCTPVY